MTKFATVKGKRITNVVTIILEPLEKEVVTNVFTTSLKRFVFILFKKMVKCVNFIIKVNVKKVINAGMSIHRLILLLVLALVVTAAEGATRIEEEVVVRETGLEI